MQKHNLRTGSIEIEHIEQTYRFLDLPSMGMTFLCEIGRVAQKVRFCSYNGTKMDQLY
jgi:hypothetical protein